MKINQNLLQNLLTSIIISFVVVGFVWAFTGPGSNQPPNGDPTFWRLNGTKMYYSGGNVGIGTTNPTSTLTVAGQIWSTTSGFKFPDNTTQTTTAKTVGSRATALGNFQTSSDSMVDITDASITLTTGARRVFLIFSSKVHNSTNGCGVQLQFTIDGGGAGQQRTSAASGGVNASQIATISYLTDVLSAGSHTFKVQAARDNVCGTAIINDATNGIFSAFETTVE